MMSHDENEFHRSVFVIGAGPVGLTAALALRKQGISATVLEAEREGRPRPGSRAIYFHKATLKILEDIHPGTGFAFASEGIVWPLKRTLWRGKEVYQKRYASPTPGSIPPFASLPQDTAERILYDACLSAGVEFIWNAAIEDVKTDHQGVTLTTRSGQVWTGDYVIGADGARSAVRHAVGIEMEGTRSANNFVVVDVKEDPEDPLPLERVFHYHHPAVGGRNVLYVPFSGGWRVDLQLFEGDDPDEYSGTEGVSKWLPKVMDEKYVARVTWVSTYQFLQVVAKNFTDKHQRVFLAGEAAHLFAPFGARGLNSGVPDAFSAAKAIHTAMQAENQEEAAQAMIVAADERQRAAQYNRDAAGIALEHLQGQSLGMSVKRQVAASLASIWPQFGRWLDEGPYGPRSGPSEAMKY